MRVIPYEITRITPGPAQVNFIARIRAKKNLGMKASRGVYPNHTVNRNYKLLILFNQRPLPVLRQILSCLHIKVREASNKPFYRLRNESR